MKKNLLVTAFVLISFLGFSGGAYAQTPTNMAAAHMPAADSPQVFNNPYGQDIEQMLKVQEDFLRKIKIRHEDQERQQHVVKTDKMYRRAVKLYHEKRSDQARDKFAKVEDSMADYKSTLSYLNIIDERSIQKLRQSMLKIRKMKGTQMVISLFDQAASMYRVAQSMSDDKYFIMLSDKLSHMARVLQGIKCDKIAASRQLAQQDTLDQIAKEASNYDEEIVKLIRTRDYTHAQEKYNEFQKTMAHRLISFKEEFKPSVLVKPETLFHKMRDDKGYRQQEAATFRQALDLYRQKQYFEAKGIFDQLASQGDPRAMAYSRKIDHILE